MHDLSLTPRHRKQIENWIVHGGQYFTHSSLLGWTVKPYGEAHIYRSNSRGLRANREYTREPPPGIVRLASFGDSFTHCADVGSEDSWQHRLETLDPHLEALNFGVDAYGLDQSFLRYSQDGLWFRPHIVLVGFMSENINRSVSVFRPFYQPQTGAPLVKPRFRLDSGGLRVIPNPIPEVEGYQALLDDTTAMLRRLGEYDSYYQVLIARRSEWQLPSLRLYRTISKILSSKDPLLPGFRNDVYDTNSEAYRVTERLIDRFYLTALENGSLPIVLLFPNRIDMMRHERGQMRRYQSLIDHMEHSGYSWIDLLEPLANVNPAKRFGDGSHYAPAGNDAVARAILDYLRSRDLNTVSGIKERLARARERFSVHSTN